MAELEQLLTSGFSQLGLNADSAALQRYRTYYEMLEETNKVMNLTAISGEHDCATLHFLDCAALLSHVDLAGKKVIDVGTGAGFPGLALKIACPEMDLTLLDSLDKRIGFLSRVSSAAGLENVQCVHARAEEIPIGFREQFDIATARAVARLNLLCELCLPYVKPGGLFVAMKGHDLSEELSEAEKAIRTLGGSLVSKIDYTVPTTEITHSLVIIRKERSTPKQYPRRWAQIKKAPL